MFWFYPSAVFAAVFVSEIAWMGTDVSASNEWIELENDGDTPVSLDGWILKAKDGSPSILLSGTIDPHAYFLIERTDDDSVPGVTADLVATFGKGISNEGETLELKDASGGIIDTVKGGKDWKSVGGNAKEKLTPQKREGKWITTLPTPRSAPPVALPPPSPTLTIRKSVLPPLTPAKAVSASPQPPSAPLPDKEETPTSLVEVYREENIAAAGGSAKDSSRAGSLSLLGLLLLLGTGGVLSLRKKFQSEADEYTIIEEDEKEWPEATASPKHQL
jgi:hypothetical protein